MSYAAPVKDIDFVLGRLIDPQSLAGAGEEDGCSLDLARAVVDECARLNQEVVSPLNVAGDRIGSQRTGSEVTTPPGFVDAYHQYVDGGWQGISHAAKHGGQGLPKVIGAACMEMVQSANLAFSLCPLLTDGAIEALTTAASDEVNNLYLKRLISGQWTGTMNLTEPQAGSDLALIRSRAEPEPDGTFRISGTKIFITWGEHDLTENIVHLVLARTPTAPHGVKGISLFVVPKFRVDSNGALGERNAVECVSLEHKLGIHASPTAVMEYKGAIGHLVGEENRGLEYMFVMMNAARFAVGMQGIAVSAAAYQKAATYAKERVQGRPVDGSSNSPVPIIEHPDVRRMLMEMLTLTESARALAYVVASYADLSKNAKDVAARKQFAGLYEFLVPIVKAWSTEISIDVANLGIQVHGGMGYIEETGAAQYLRDARILSIYEGTTAIQANDLLGRKLLRDQGSTARVLLGMIDNTLEELEAPALVGVSSADSMRRSLQLGRDVLEDSTQLLLSRTRDEPKACFGVAVPYLKLCGLVLSGWQMARSLLCVLSSPSSDTAFDARKIAGAHFFATHLLPRAVAYASTIQAPKGLEEVMALSADSF